MIRLWYFFARNHFDCNLYFISLWNVNWQFLLAAFSKLVDMWTIGFIFLCCIYFESNFELLSWLFLDAVYLIWIWNLWQWWLWWLCNYLTNRFHVYLTVSKYASMKHLRHFQFLLYKYLCLCPFNVNSANKRLMWCKLES